MVMNSHHQSVMLEKPSVVAEPPRSKPDSLTRNLGDLSSGLGVHGKDTMVGYLEEFIGVLEVYIHQARNVHNICIYQEQDVYAKLCLTSDPERAVSTQIINGGGRNPIFNESVRLNVATISSSLKCEIWMLSRAKNYLEDQMLGFALVPLSDILIGNGKLAQEFSLSSTDLFHSPAGFVQLSLEYTGASPDVLEIPRLLHSSLAAKAAGQVQGKDSVTSISHPCELDMIEFPDPKIMNENHMMVSEYFGIQCDMDSQSSDSLNTADNDSQPSSNISVDHPQESSPSVSASPRASNASNQDRVSTTKEEKMEDVENIEVETEKKVVQQDIVDMYLKSMQEFTESLAKMKLPMDTEKNESDHDSGNTGLDEKLQQASSTDERKLQETASKGSGQRVFYGSRAFF